MHLTRWLATAGSVAVLLSPIAARADITKDECLDANTAGQKARRATKLTEARAQFQQCVDPACPDIVREDCIERMNEAQSAQPTIVFDVKSGAGEDLTDVAVAVDGAPVAASNAGAAIVVDPGPHEFTFSVAGQAPVTRTFVLKEGEKGRRERVQIGEAPPPPPIVVAPVAPLPPPTSPTPPPSDGHTQRTVAWIGGAVAVVAVSVGLGFGVKAISNSSDQKTDCETSTSCRNRNAALQLHGDAKTASTLSTVLVISGAVVLAGSAVVYFVAPHAPRTTALLRSLTTGVTF